MSGTNKKINWSIVGLGSQAEKIATAIQSSKNGLLFGVFSKDKKHAEDFAQKFGAKQAFSSLDDMLKQKEINAVFVASPNYEHADQCLSALAAGKHVLCEKPLAMSLREGQLIKKAVQKNKVKFGVGFHLRQHRLIQEAWRIITDNQLGEIKLIEINWSVGQLHSTKLPPLNQFKSWREDPTKSGGGAIMARGVHMFDLLRFLTGLEVDEITAFTDNQDKAVDATAVGICKMGSALAYLATSRLLPNALNTIVVYGSAGRLILRDVLKADGGGVLEWFDGAKIKIKKTHQENLYQKEIEEFGALINGRHNGSIADVDDGLASVAITEAFFKSVSSGKIARVGK